MTDDGENVVCRNYAHSGGSNMRQQRLAPNFMQNFWQLRFQPRAFTRSHGGDSDLRLSRRPKSSTNVHSQVSSFASLYLDGELQKSAT